MFKRAIKEARDSDPQRIALYEAYLFFIEERRQVGHRWFRSGSFGLEVEVGVGQKSQVVGLPVTDDEALALAAGRAHVVTRGTVRSHSLRIVVGQPGEHDHHESKPRLSKSAAEPGFVQRMMATGRTKRIAEIDKLLSRYAAQITQLENERTRLQEQSAA